MASNYRRNIKTLEMLREMVRTLDGETQKTPAMDALRRILSKRIAALEQELTRQRLYR